MRNDTENGYYATPRAAKMGQIMPRVGPKYTFFLLEKKNTLTKNRGAWHRSSCRAANKFAKFVFIPLLST
jgi:hypothetical protein